MQLEVVLTRLLSLQNFNNNHMEPFNIIKTVSTKEESVEVEHDDDGQEEGGYPSDE